ncbi:uncharacterized protein [Palaemon carinicauda]|uniref:uncharacterized protein n=1 Tax=Palaemon carinicauda TaxID=392227 RepID=UPI0035B5A8EE
MRDITYEEDEVIHKSFNIDVSWMIGFSEIKREITIWKCFYEISCEKIEHGIPTTYAGSIIVEYQCGFRAEQSTIDQIFSLRQVIEKYWEYNKQQTRLVIDFKQAYGSIHRPSMWNIMREFGIPLKLVGLEINEGKTKIMEVARTPQLQGNVDLAGIRIETVESFKYLGTIMSQNAGMAEEVTARIGDASRCYLSLTDLFKRRSITRKTKLRIYNTAIRPVLIYGCETLSLTKILEKTFEIFENGILRGIEEPIYDEEINVWRRRHNREIRNSTNQPNICDVVRSRRLQWAGHMARMDEDRAPKRIILAEVAGRRPVGWPRKDWRRCLEEDVRISGGT